MNGERVLLLGGSGLLGRSLAAEFRRRGIGVSAPGRAELDIRDRAAAGWVLERERPAWVVNAAALCDFEGCEARPEESRAVNRDGPIGWAEECARRGVRMCQFSSDYVFDGESRVPYGEGSAARGLSVYGRDKASMEEGFLSYPGHLVVRVAWLFGVGGRTYMSLLPGLLMGRSEVRVASGRVGSCLYAPYGARLVAELMARGVSGRVNVAHAGEVTWEGYAAECLRRMREAGWGPRCERIVEEPFDRLLASRARRPAYSVLDVGRCAALLGEAPQPWQDGLAAYLRDWRAAAAGAV